MQRKPAPGFFLRFVIGWETFISEWFIGCVNRDATRGRADVDAVPKRWRAPLD
jgi:hypothetical protein